MSIKVLIIEESAYQRNLFSEILSSQDNISVIDAMRDGDKYIENFNDKLPDVLILDIGMAKLDDLDKFRYIMNNIPVPTILLTFAEPKTFDPSLRPLVSKAFDLIVKPKGIWEKELPKIKNILIDKVILASSKKSPIRIDNKIRLLNKNLFIQQVQQMKAEKKSKQESISVPKYETGFFNKIPIKINKLETNIIVMGASVGGPKTLKSILSDIPNNLQCPILVVQHMNHFFMRQFAVTLRDRCSVKVKLAHNGEPIQPGIIYLPHGDKHMEIFEKGGKPFIHIYEGEPVNFCRPSVDVLFLSAARVYKKQTLGILLTGMGRDGVDGLKAIKECGGKTIAESQETAILYGMPKVAAESGVADIIVPNHEIRKYIVRFSKKPI